MLVMEHGLRERKKRQTRTALVRAALELCEAKGVEHVTVGEIAEAANVSRRTFFNYFSSREEAILGGGAQRGELLAACLAGRPVDESVWDALRAAFADFLASDEEPEREWLARARLVRASPSLIAQQRMDYAQMENRLVAEVARRTHTDADALTPRVIVASAVAAMRVAVNHWIDTPTEPHSLAEVIDGAMARVGAGFAVDVRHP